MTAPMGHDQRDKTATRLLNSSSRNSYDPLVDIDWSAEPQPRTPPTCPTSGCRSTAPSSGSR